MRTPESQTKKMKAPSKEMLEYYASLYNRNQSKFIRKSLLELHHLGSEFEFEEKKYKLLGAVDANLMLVKDEEENHFMMSSTIVTKQILGKN